MSSEMLAALGAFLSGVGSILGAAFVIRALRKRMHEECEERLRALREGFRMGKEQ